MTRARADVEYKEDVTSPRRFPFPTRTKFMERALRVRFHVVVVHATGARVFVVERSRRVL